MLKTMLFDVDGVLLIGERWDKDLAVTYGVTPDALTPFFRGPFQQCLVGKADLKAELALYLPGCGWQQSVDDFIDFWFRRHLLDEQLMQAIQRLRRRGIRCYLATQQEHYRTEYLLHEVGFAQRFDGMFSSADIGTLKSDVCFFRAILDILKDCSPAEIFFWDDVPANVATARSAGIQAEVYSDFAAFQQTMLSLVG